MFIETWRSWLHKGRNVLLKRYVLSLAKSNESRLGLSLCKVNIFRESNQETSITIGESVRDEDGELLLSLLKGFYY
jgi:phosphoribosylpyrophosphate synthetase